MIIAFNIIMIILFLMPIVLTIYFYFERKNILKKIEINRSDDDLFVSIIIPFLGEDFHLEKTIKALIKQKYTGGYEVLFVTSDHLSPNISKIEQEISKNKNIYLLYSEKTEIFKNRGDKINNLLTGIRNSSKESQVFLFMDSDMVPGEYWIYNMIQTLNIPDCGLATGSDWIVSKSNDILSKATRFWDFFATTMITFPLTNFARGSQMGIKKSTFEKLNMKEKWNNAFHDNYTISTAVRNAKLRIYYAPYCLTEEYFDISGFEWIRWIKRQAVHTKIHYKKLWFFGFFCVTLPRFIGGLGFVIILIMAFMNQQYLKSYICFIVWPLIHFITAVTMIQCIYPDAKRVEKYDASLKGKMKLILISYVTVLHCIGSIWAVFSNKIIWRDRVYEEKNDNETLLIRRRDDR